MTKWHNGDDRKPFNSGRRGGVAVSCSWAATSARHNTGASYAKAVLNSQIDGSVVDMAKMAARHDKRRNIPYLL